MPMVFVFLSFVVCSYSLTQQQYDTIAADVRGTLEPPSSDFEAQADFFGGVVRLPFHDAGSYDKSDGSGRPGACVNPFDPANNGLAEIINGIEPVYQKYKDWLSRADYWVLVAHVAVQDAGGPNMPYYSGRIDCTAYPPAGRLPNAEKNWTEVNNVFVQRMGLDVVDIVALIGAHTLGRCMPENSGYEFFWTPSANRFTNQFYRQLTLGNWKLYSNNFAFHGTTHQWDTNPVPTDEDPQMMLNTDMSLAYAIPDASSASSCTTTPGANCPANTVTSSYVTLFANNQTAWFNAFTLGWNKMTGLGYEGKLFPLQAKSTDHEVIV